MLMAERLYEDIKFVTQQNSTQMVDEDGARAYNALLAKARRHYPQVEYVHDFPDWSARTIKYKDALVVAGQFWAMLRALTEPEPRERRPMPVSPHQAASHQGATPPQRDPSSTNIPGLPPPPGTTPLPVDLRPRAQREPARVSGKPVDEELYGSTPPPKRNNDGTIPFTLE